MTGNNQPTSGPGDSDSFRSADLNDALAGARDEVRDSQEREVLPAKSIGGYECVRVLGKGGQAIVFEGRKKLDGQEESVRRAIKVFTGTNGFDEDLIDSEVAMLARFNHENIVRIYDFDKCEYAGQQRRYLAMELVDEAQTLEAYYAEQSAKDPSNAIALACNLVRHVCRGLQHAHFHFAIHRDLKPHNILVDSNGVPKIADFGVARDVKPLDIAADTQALEEGFFGTLRYSSPEHHRGAANVDQRSDVYSLGVVLFELLAKTSPYEAQDVSDLIKAISSDGAKSLGAADAKFNTTSYRDLQAIVGKALELDPKARYQSAHEFENDIDNYLAYKPVAARTPWWHERAWKYWRRSSATVRLLFTATIILTLLAACGFAYSYSRNLKLLEATSKQKADREQRLYAAVISQSQKLEGNSAHAVSLLNSIVAQDWEQDLRGWEWWRLQRIFHSELHLLEGHVAAVNCVAYQPTGSYLATGSTDGVVVLWDSATGLEVKRLKHKAGVLTVAFDSAGKRLAAGCDDASVYVWDVASGELRKTLKSLVLPIRAVTFHPTENTLICGDDGGFLLVHNLDTSAEHLLPTGASTVRSVAATKDGKLIAASVGGFGGNRVQLWDVAKRQLLRSVVGNTSFLDFTSDSKQLLYGGINDLRIANVLDGTVAQKFSHYSADLVQALPDTQSTHSDGRDSASFARPTRGFQHAAFLPGETEVMTIDDGMVQVWDVQTQRALHSVRLQGSRFAIHPDGERFAAPCGDKRVRVWKTKQDVDARIIEAHHLRASSLTFSAGGKLFSGSYDHSIKQIDPNNGETLGGYGVHEYQFEEREGHSAPVLKGIDNLDGHNGSVMQIALSPDEQRLASVGMDNRLIVWNVDTRTELFQARLPSMPPDVIWSPSGKQIAVACWDDDIHLYDGETGALNGKLVGHQEDVYGVAYLDDATIVSCSQDNTIRFWNLTTSECTDILRPSFEGLLTCLAVSPDRRWLAIGGENPEVAIFDLSSRKEVASLLGHTSRIGDVLFSPDSRRLVTVAGSTTKERSVRLWDTSTFSELYKVPGSHAAAFSRDGKQLAVRGARGTIVVYDSNPLDDQPFRTGLPLAKIPTANMVAADDSLRLLGAYLTDEIGGTYGAPPVVTPNSSDNRLLVIVMSTPQAVAVYDEENYAAYVAKQPAGTTIPKRQNLLVNRAKDYSIVDAEGKAKAAQFLGVWPPGTAESGVSELIEHSSSAKFQPDVRQGSLVVVEVAPETIKWPLKVTIGDRSATLSEATLPVDHRYDPSQRARYGHIVRLWQEGEHERAIQGVRAFGNASDSAGNAFNVAQLFAIGAAFVKDNQELEDVQRDALIEQLSLFAVEAIESAITRGFDTLKDFDEEDVPLAILHERADYQAAIQPLRDKQQKEKDSAPSDGKPDPDVKKPTESPNEPMAN